MPTFSSREFNQKVSEAKKAASDGPVFITDPGVPRHVLMTIEDYYRLVGSTSIVDLISMPETDDIEFEPPKAAGVARKVDLPDVHSGYKCHLGIT